jgi:hypothetical protein
MNPEWVEDSVLKGQSFCVWVGAGKAAPRQYTFHRPIGETPLDVNQWVATPTDEVSLLLERRKGEAQIRYERERAAAIRAAILAAGTGRRVDPANPQNEVWSFDGAPPIAVTIRAAETAAEAAGRPKSEWVNHTDAAVRAAELQFKQALRNGVPPPDWLAEHPPPAYETRGGPLGDRPQLAVPYLNGLSLSSARDAVLRRMLSFDLPTGEDEDDTDDEVEGGRAPPSDGGV